ncbi:MAG: phenylalanine--tRNA ligase subunit beta [Deltaproteobacteria bacterium]|nr:phenylalanine--tRNA ligase subunit beta [Deltaproteobacteria bacterium]
MRLSLNWLRDYVDIDMLPGDLAHLLTMSGLEVETIEPLGHSLQGVVAAEILSVRRHAEADRLFICHVDTGNGRAQVVCSAPNLEAGALVPMALPGIKLPGGVKVEEGLIRGERSVGMLLAEDEMGLTDDHTGIMILPSGLKPGDQVSSALHLEDWALEISITPNRPDCASVIGVAREIAALTGQKLRSPEIRIEEGNTFIEDLADVTIDDPKGCPRYAAGMIRGVELKPSPFWLRHRLYSSGVRSINNVVDVTNYVMLEMGQPLHAFDYERLKESRIVVRRSEKGETFTTLDGQTHTLNEEILLICDGRRPVALAGIMGGLNSEIFAGSRNVLLESACFDPVTIRRGSKRLGLSTEASYRFERGTDIEGVIMALRRAMGLISHLTDGDVIDGIIDKYPRPYHAPVIDLRIDQTNNFLGTSISRKTISGYLKALTMEVRDVNNNVVQVKPPAFRVDITREVDLVEEVARMEGYDKIPVTSPHIRVSDEADAPELIISDRIREIMVGLGFTEVISYSFTSPDFPDLVGAGKGNHLRSFVRLLNPLTVDQSVMRTSLVPGLLAAIKTNISHGEEDIKLFEWGKIFLNRDGDELPHEEPLLTAIMTGLYNPKTWYHEERVVDFYHIKGAVEGLLKALGLRGGILFKKGETPHGYHKERSAAIYLSGLMVGSVGQFSPEVLERYDIKTESTYLFELNMQTLLEKIEETKRFEAFAKFPAVFRDISIIIKKHLESAGILGIIKREGGELVESVDLFDLYEGKKINQSEKAMTFRICYRSKDGTLDGKEINRLHETIIDKIRQETGGRLREG